MGIGEYRNGRESKEGNGWGMSVVGGGIVNGCGGNIGMGENEGRGRVRGGM